MPAISQFEDKLLGFYSDQSKLNAIVTRMDKVLCEKADKENLRELTGTFKEKYVTRKMNKEMREKVLDTLELNEIKMKELDEKVKF